MSEILRFETAADTLRARVRALSGSVRVAVEVLLSDIQHAVEGSTEKTSGVTGFIENMNMTSLELTEKFSEFYADSSIEDRQTIINDLLNENESAKLSEPLASFMLKILEDSMRSIEQNVGEMEEGIRRAEEESARSLQEFNGAYVSICEPASKLLH